MSYEPTTWVNGDIITATKMNNIESGVQSVSSSYTPTTWVNGDIITAQKMNNIEQGIANAGGGSSDFSTATVTFGSVNIMELPYIDGDSVVVGVNDATTYQVPIKTGGTLDVDIDGIPPTAFSTTGAVEVVAKGLRGATVSISGDCTIAIED